MSVTTSSSTPITPNDSRSTPVHSLFSSKNNPPPPLAGEGRGEGKPLRIALVIAALLVGGCSMSKWTVKPHQRELLADKIMQLDADSQEREAEEHVLANREGAIGGTGTSGGGCGCN